MCDRSWIQFLFSEKIFGQVILQCIAVQSMNHIARNNACFVSNNEMGKFTEI